MCRLLYSYTAEFSSPLGSFQLANAKSFSHTNIGSDWNFCFPCRIVYKLQGETCNYWWYFVMSSVELFPIYKLPCL